MILTLDKFKLLCPSVKTPELFVEALNRLLSKYNISDHREVVWFLVQTIHESSSYTRFRENMNYNAKGLCNTWSKRFPTLNSAKPYERNPEKIANKVYANRLGNGDENSGDGWKYRGIGIIQLTGKSNIQAFAASIGKSLDDTMIYLNTVPGLIESACWFWKFNNLSKFCDTNDFKGLCKAINGGLIGYDARVILKDKIEKLL